MRCFHVNFHCSKRGKKISKKNLAVDLDKMGRFLRQSLNRFSIGEISKVFARTRFGLVEETKVEFEGSTHFLRLSCRHRWGFEPRFHVTHQTQSTIFQRFRCVMTYNKMTEVQIQRISWSRIFLQDEYLYSLRESLRFTCPILA